MTDMRLDEKVRPGSMWPLTLAGRESWGGWEKCKCHESQLGQDVMVQMMADSDAALTGLTGLLQSAELLQVWMSPLFRRLGRTSTQSAPSWQTI